MPMRLFLVALLLILTSASTASAQVIATEPTPEPAALAREPVPQPVHTERDEPKGRGQEYVFDILIAGAVTTGVTMAGVGMMAASEGDGELMQAGATIGGLGMLAHFISGPAIHGAHHGFNWRTMVSVGTRVGIGFGIPGLAAAVCSEQGGCEHAGGIIAGTFAAGLVVPVLIDTAIAFKPRSEPSSAVVVPWAAPTNGGAAAGVTGKF